MSRTDKDRPYWVRLNDPTEEYRDSYRFGFNVRLAWSPSREERRSIYYGPMRSETRDTLRNVVKEYNSYGDINEDFFLRERSRHSRYHGGEW